MPSSRPGKIDAAGLREHEPHVAGVAGLLVPETGIVDYKAVAKSYVGKIEAAVFCWIDPPEQPLPIRYLISP